MIKALMVILTFWLSANAYAVKMTVILPQAHEWSSVYQAWATSNVDHLSVQHLIRVDHLEQRLSEGLPADETHAAEMARVLAEGAKDQAIMAWEQALLIRRLEIDQVPVIIINQHVVFYGLNPRLAMDAYTRFNQ